MNFPIRWLAAVLLLGACSAATVTPPAAAQDSQRPAAALNVAPLAGQPVPVLPATYIVADSVAGIPAVHSGAVAWADSIIGEALESRGPEVQWVLPPALRHAARRAPATVTDPDRMGQAILRAPKLDRIPDPLRIYMRSLAAVTNSRMMMVPAAIRFAYAPGGVRAEVDLVLADARSGSVLWRSRPHATAVTADAALKAAIVQILPDAR